MISPEQIPDEPAKSDYITQWDWHKPLRVTPTATTNALPGMYGTCYCDEQIARLRAENEKLRAALNADPQTLRLHLGEMTAQEVRTLRAGFQWVLASAALK